jgi:hypothetical protein
LAFFAGLGADHSATNWQNHFQTLCTSIIEQDGRHLIGGPGQTVEIDKSQIFQRKANVERLLTMEDQNCWFFGGICHKDGGAFITLVKSRDAETLRAAIEENIAQGTRVISDGWRGYCSLTNHGWEHSVVNHSENFVDPSDPTINTQRIERMWKTVKHQIPKECNSKLRWSYINEFLFKKRYQWHSLTPGQRILLLIRKLRNIRFI